VGTASGLAVALAIVVTVLLHFKAQIEGFSVRLTAKDVASLLQFAVLSLVILPVVPNEGFGPYGAFNPYHLWLMVVLISAVSLAGYLAFRLAGGRAPALLLGAMGGLVSSTATTLVFARGAKGRPELENTAATVILLANLVVFVRIAVLTAVVAPALLPVLAPVLAGPVATPRRHGSLGSATARGRLREPGLTNPTDLRRPLSRHRLRGDPRRRRVAPRRGGARGSTASLRPGLTDVDAISLSAMRLFGERRYRRPPRPRRSSWRSSPTCS
jgi:hypothetical protein